MTPIRGPELLFPNPRRCGRLSRHRRVHMTTDQTHRTETPTRAAGTVTGSDRWQHAEGLVALGTVLLTGLRLNLAAQVPLGFVLLVFTAPLWLRFVGRNRQAKVLLALLLAAVASGLLLTIYA